jgi:hypothetical protein
MNPPNLSSYVQIRYPESFSEYRSSFGLYALFKDNYFRRFSLKRKTIRAFPKETGSPESIKRLKLADHLASAANRFRVQQGLGILNHHDPFPSRRRRNR